MLGGLLAVAFVCACAPIVRYDPHPMTTEMSPGEGLFVLHVVTDVPVDAIEISGVRLDVRLPPGDHLLLFAASPGPRAFERLWRKVGRGEAYWEIERQIDEPGFEIVPGRLSYGGSLIATVPRDVDDPDRWLSVRLANRSAMVAEALEEVLPGGTEGGLLLYTGRGQDPYLDALRATRANRAEPAPGSSPETGP